MKKTLLIKTLAGTLVTYALAGFFGVPYMLKNIAPAKVEEATKGGEFSVKKVFFNPFTLRLSLEEMSFKTPDSASLLDIKKFAININPMDYLWNGGWVIHELTFEEPHITVVKDSKGEFNFGWLSGGEDKNESETKTPLPNLIIENFTLRGGIIDYADYSEGKDYQQRIDPIGFHLENIHLRNMSNNKGDMRLYATINEGGFVDIRGRITGMDPYKIDGSVALNSGKLYTPWRYFQDKFPIEVADGSVSLGFNYHVDSSDLNSTELTGLHVEGSKLRILAKKTKENLFSLASMQLKEGNAQPLKKVFNADSVLVNGINLSASRSAKGKIDWVQYAEEIKAAFPEDENETKEPWKFKIGSVDVKNVSLAWHDQAPKVPYSATVENIGVQAGVISSDEKVPLSITAHTGALRIVRHKGNELIGGFQALAVDGIELNREGRFARVSKVSMENPTVSIERLQDGQLDISQCLYASKEPSKPSSEKPFGFQIDDMHFNNGAVDFKDNVPPKTVTINLNALNLQVSGLQSNPTISNRIAFDTRVNQTGELSLKGEMTRSPLKSAGNIVMKGIDLAMLDPYIEPSSYASLRRGILGVKVDYRYQNNKAAVQGVVALEDWVVNDRRDNSVLLGWQSIGVTPFSYLYPDNRLKINQLNINGLYTNALIDSKKVLNYSTLSKGSSAPQEQKKSDHPFGLDIVKLTLSNSSATFADQSLPLPFKTYIHDLEGSILGVSTTKDVTTSVKLKGGVDRYGMAKIDGYLNTKAPKNFTDLAVRFDNLELKQYTPYSLQFLGYEIDKGKLFLNLGYKIDQGKLLGKNQVTIKQIELGKEQAGGSPWPMRLVVALLEDSEGIIDIDLPVEGDVNKPDFKYGKVVWQVIGNLLTKAVTSPFRFLSSLMGIESDALSSIQFDPGSFQILPSELEKIDKIAEMLKKRPKLALQIYGGTVKDLDEKGLKKAKLIQVAVAQDKNSVAGNEHTITLPTLESMAKEALGRSYVNTMKDKLRDQHPEEAIFVGHYTQALVDALIPLQMIEPDALERLAAKRSLAIAEAFKKTPGLESRISLQPNETAKAGETGGVANRLEMVVR